MKIVAISDTHNRHRDVEIPEGDVLVHAGDITAHGTLEEVEAFNAYLGELPHPQKIVIAGNHDFCLEQTPEASARLLSNATYLQDQATTVDGFLFYGSPWQPWFCNLAFNLRRGAEIRAKWDLIPDGVDVLITHGPPRGFGDRTSIGQRVGCHDLLDAVERIEPRLHVYGHIHEAAGTFSNGVTTFLNACVFDRYSGPVFEPSVVELER